MPKPEKGTPKWIANQWRKKGLSKLRWHCGLCGVSCKDANGFRMHLEHENHLRRELEQEGVERERADNVEARYMPDQFSEAFERNFLKYLATEKVGQRVRAHEAYRALHPEDRQHNNMHKTCWGTLGRFIVDLRERGEVEAEREGNGWIVFVTEEHPAATWAGLSDADARAIRGKDDIPLKRAWNEVEDEMRQKRRCAGDQLEDVMAQAERAKAEAPPDDRGTTATALGEGAAKVAFGFGGTAAASSSSSSSSSCRPCASAAAAPARPRTWLRRGLVVKARCGKTLHGGHFDKVKCVVLRVRGPDDVLVEALDASRDANVSERHLETVIPNIGKPVRVVRGAHDGKAATLLALHLDTYDATVRLHDGGAILEKVPYEHICKDQDLRSTA